MIAIHFDSNDSYIHAGETLYFKNEDSINPFLIKELTKLPLKEQIMYEGGYDSEEEMLKDMLDENPWWFDYWEITTVD